MARATLILGSSVSIALGAAVAAGAGLFAGFGRDSVDHVTLSGATVAFTVDGVYRSQPVWFASEAIAWDAVTLFLGVPGLLAASWAAYRGSLRGQIVQAGLLAYVFYQFLLWAVGWFTVLFPLHVVLYSASLITLILCLTELDTAALASSWDRVPRRTLSVFLGLIALMLLGLWGPLVLSSAPTASVPDQFEGVMTLAVQATDLGLLVPLGAIGAVLVWQRRAWGLVMGAIATVKGAAMGAAIVAMILTKAAITGEPVEAGNLAMFAAMTVFAVGLLGATLRGVPDRAGG